MGNGIYIPGLKEHETQTLMDSIQRKHGFTMTSVDSNKSAPKLLMPGGTMAWQKLSPVRTIHLLNCTQHERLNVQFRLNEFGEAVVTIIDGKR